MDYSEGRGSQPVEVALFPGFAEVGSTERWAATVSVRLYADSNLVARLEAPSLTIAPGATGTATFTLPEASPPVRLGDGFFPLGILVAPVHGRTWTREVGLPEPPRSSPR